MASSSRPPPQKFCGACHEGIPIACKKTCPKCHTQFSEGSKSARAWNMSGQVGNGTFGSSSSVRQARKRVRSNTREQKRVDDNDVEDIPVPVFDPHELDEVHDVYGTYKNSCAVYEPCVHLVAKQSDGAAQMFRVPCCTSAGDIVEDAWEFILSSDTLLMCTCNTVGVANCVTAIEVQAKPCAGATSEGFVSDCVHVRLLKEEVPSFSSEVSSGCTLSIHADKWLQYDDGLCGQCTMMDAVVHDGKKRTHEVSSSCISISDKGRVWPRRCVAPTAYKGFQVWMCKSCALGRCNSPGRDGATCDAVLQVQHKVQEQVLVQDNDASPLQGSILNFFDVWLRCEVLNMSMDSHSGGVIKPVSNTAIPRHHVWAGSKDRMKQSGDLRDEAILRPPTLSCGCTGGFSHALRAKGALLLHTSASYKVDVYGSVCLTCHQLTSYDGFEDGIFNFSNGTLATHELCWKYYDELLLGGRTFAEFWRVQDALFARLDFQHVSRFTLTQVLKSFMSLVHVDLAQSFTCDTCCVDGKPPRAVVCDGCTCGMLSSTFPREEESSTLPRTTVSNLSRFYIISSVDVRKHVKKVLASGTWKMPSAEINSDSAVLTFIDYCARYDPRDVLDGREEVDISSSHALQDFLKEAVTTNLACAYLTADVAESMRNEISQTSTLSLDTMKRVKEASRLVYSWIVDVAGFRDRHTLTPDGDHPALAQFLLDFLLKCNMVTPNAEADNHHTDALLEVGGGLDDLTIGNWPRVRVMARYSADVRAEESSCTKNRTTTYRLSPGVFLILCPHGVVHLIHFMRTCEGPTTAAKLFYERWEHAPSFVWYDNACHLHKSCMVREPAFFSNMECNIDIFHQFDHTTCGNAFCHKKKTQDRVVCEPLKFSQANTSGAEQANNRLKLLRKQLAYSSYATARLLLTHFIAWWNDRVKAREHTST